MYPGGFTHHQEEPQELDRFLLSLWNHCGNTLARADSWVIPQIQGHEGDVSSAEAK